MTLGERIRKERKRVGLKQQELGQMLSVSQNTISMYETGKRTPDILSLKMMAEIFGISMDEFILSLPKSPASFPVQDISLTVGTPPTQFVIESQTLADFLERELMTTFRLLQYKNKLIIVGEAEKLLKAQDQENRNPDSAESNS